MPNKGYQSVKLRPNISLIEVMRRTHASEKTTVMSVSWTKPVPPPKQAIPLAFWEEDDFVYAPKPKGKEGYWNLHFIGEKPDLRGLEQ